MFLKTNIIFGATELKNNERKERLQTQSIYTTKEEEENRNHEYKSLLNNIN